MVNISSISLERIVPNDLPWFGKKIYLEHLERYKFALQYIKHKVVVDLGCGVGYGAWLLAQSEPDRVIALDKSKEAIIYAKKYYPDKP